MTARRRALLAAGLGLCLAGAGIDRPAAAGQFDGVTVNMMTFTGPQIAEPLQRRAPDFEKLTGAKINVITVPFSDLYQKLLTDWAGGTNSIDAAVFAPQWMVGLRDPRLSRGYDRPDRRRQGPAGGGCGALLPRFLAGLRRQEVHGHPRWRLPDGLLPDRRAGRSWASSRRRPGPTIWISPRLPRAWI